MPTVGYLTIVFADDVTAKTAKHLVDEIAGEAISYGAVDAVKCDVGILDGEAEIEFWAEAQQ